MIVRRLISALVALAFALALGLPPGPAQAAVSYADMPCHAEPLPAPADDGTTEAGPSCCLPLCWLAVEHASSVLGERPLPAFVKVASTSFVSVSDRPQVPPPKHP